MHITRRQQRITGRMNNPTTGTSCIALAASDKIPVAPSFHHAGLTILLLSVFKSRLVSKVTGIINLIEALYLRGWQYVQECCQQGTTGWGRQIANLCALISRNVFLDNILGYQDTLVYYYKVGYVSNCKELLNNLSQWAGVLIKSMAMVHKYKVIFETLYKLGNIYYQKSILSLGLEKHPAKLWDKKYISSSDLYFFVSIFNILLYFIIYIHLIRYLL